MIVNEISEATLTALSEKRDRIAVLHRRFEEWLTHLDQLCQRTENLLSQRQSMSVAETDLLHDARRLLTELDGSSDTLIDKTSHETTLSDTILDSQVLSFENNPANAGLSLSSDKLASHNGQPVRGEDHAAEQLENNNLAAKRADRQPLPVVIEPHAFSAMTQFEALTAYFQLSGAKRSLDEIIADLPRSGFSSQAENVEQNFRSMLRYYTGKGVFEREGESWGLPNQWLSQTASSSASSSNPDSTAELANSFGHNPNSSSAVESKRGQENTLAPPAKILSLVKPRPSGRSHNCAYPQNELTTAEYCAEILRRSGQPWLHVDQILIIMERDYGVKRRKVIVASALRKNAKAGRLFKSFGDNRFGLLEAVIGEAQASA